MKLHHLALGARDPERLAVYYRDLLGLREVSRHFEPGGRLRSVWLDLGGPVLMIERADGHAPRGEGTGGGLFLLALAAEPAERDALENLLTTSGFPVQSRTEHTVYFRDPEGNRVAISSYPLGRTP